MDDTSSSFNYSSEKRFGKLAVELGFLTEAQLTEGIRRKSEVSGDGSDSPLGSILIKLGFLDQTQVKKILKSQIEFEPGTVLGDFKLLSKLGEGAMGTVYRALQISMDRPIALKLLPPSLAWKEKYRLIFQQEARAVAKLNHPNIVAGISFGQANGLFFFAMEHVEGESLGKILAREKTVAEEMGIEVTRQIALALNHAHKHGLVHRDVKPDNILLDGEGRAKLADLGLVRLTHGEDLFAEGEKRAIGTPFYISPEQARGDADLTPATDLYSLGATLYHILSGSPLFTGANRKEVLIKHVKDAPKPLRQINPEISEETEKICMRLLEKKAEARYQSGNELAEAIESLQNRWRKERASGEKEEAPAPPNPTRETSLTKTSHRKLRALRRRWLLTKRR